MAADHIQNTPRVVMARIRLSTGSFATSTNVSAITRKVTDLGTEAVSSTNHDDASETVASVMKSPLETHKDYKLWPSNDPTGHNFRTVVAGDAFPKANTDYAIQFSVTPTTGNGKPVFVEEKIHTRSLQRFVTT